VESPQALAAQHVFGQSRFAFFQNLANANNGREPGFESRF